MKSILFDEAELQSHPIEYYEHKQNYLHHISNISRNATVKSNQIPLLTIYNQKHSFLQEQLKVKKLEEMKYLNPNTFESIFDDQPEAITTTEALKKMYYSEFIEKPIESEKKLEAEKMKKENQQIALFGLVETIKKKDNQISKEKQNYAQQLKMIQQELDIMRIQSDQVKRNEKKEICKNPKIISKLSGSLLTYYTVYFKEITDALIDDLLLDEIQYLNENNQEENLDYSIDNSSLNKQFKTEDSNIKEEQVDQNHETILRSDLKILAEKFAFLIDD